ncbi:carbohydrate ABC transporter permease [Psychromarinibacter halotolerans]|uniref:Carbohydrate ABC transporter permease n=1 Tax=Psychromarinibacter halotolerans TaxID=1775175 RepID=A0ABV7GNB2_9RHOB|nr:sugar ABC transporter permease [Psychromarinibacter halotolerans]MAQ85364.1 ABC transporter permease [Maritimibacter sp.]MDF0596835.1 sugar ABC transporter permease [Psychromarinibacter halotolerans]
MSLSQRSENAILTAPLVLFLLALLGFPTVLDIVYSLSDVSFETLRAPTFTGLDNFRAVLADPDFWQATWFSLSFAVLTSVAECVLGLALAIYFSPILRRAPWMLAILIMPMIIAPAMMGLMYRLVLHEFIGPLPNYLYNWFGVSYGFLTAQNVFTTIFVIETLQWTPFALLLFHMAYESIPEDIREAASVDGTRTWRMLTRIELPLMLPTLGVALFIRFIDGFRVFDNIWTLTGTGPGGSTTSLSIYIYVAFFRSGEIGQAIAASMILFAAAFLVLFVAARRGRGKETA